MTRLFRYEWAVWLASAALLAWAVGAAIPGLPTRFAFREMFAPGHPAREAYDAFDDDFGLGTRVTLNFHGAAVFGGPFLDGAVELTNRLKASGRARRVFSPLDLPRPSVSGRQQGVGRVLRGAVRADPARLRAALARPPLDGLFEGLLYDRTRTTFTMVVTPPVDGEDLAAGRRFVTRMLADAEALAAAHGVELFVGGYRFAQHEIRRVGRRAQARLSAAAAAIELALFWALFGSLRVALQVVFLLATSVVMSLAAMSAVGLPLNLLGFNLGVMVVVIGTADQVHLISAFAAARRAYGPLGAARRAARRAATPMLLTSLTTSGCLLVTSATPLAQLRRFSLALALSVMVTWAVVVILGPLLVRRSGLDPTRGALFGLQDRFEALGLRGAWYRHPALPAAFGAAALVCLALATRQRVDTNWFRIFPAGTPVARSLAFFDRVGYPVSTVDCTLDTGRKLAEVLADPDLRADVRALAAAIGSRPGVQSVGHLYQLADYVEAELAGLEYPPEVPPRWRPMRRDALRRQFGAGGFFDRYFSPESRRLRLVIATDRESARDLLDLQAEIRAATRDLPLRTLRAGDLRFTGQMHYWSAIVAELPRLFARNIAGGAALVFGFFLVMTGSLRLALACLAPNLFPILVMLGLGTLPGTPLDDTFSLTLALAVGIAVDDTLHFLFHYLASRRRGRPVDEAITEGFRVAGVPIVVTSVLLAAGFGVSLTSALTPIFQIGYLLILALGAALAADLLLLPRLIWWAERPPAASDPRGYRLAPGDPSKPRRRRRGGAPGDPGGEHPRQ